MLPVQAVCVRAARHLAVEFCKAVCIQFQPAADLIVERAVEGTRGAVALGVKEGPSTIKIEPDAAERRCGRVVAASRAIGAAAGARAARRRGLVARAGLAEHVGGGGRRVSAELARRNYGTIEHLSKMYILKVKVCIS